VIAARRMEKDDLTDRQALILALFRYGLASTPEDVAQELKIGVREAVTICRRLARDGLIHAAGVAVTLAA